jgi:hypothetical protein
MRTYTGSQDVEPGLYFSMKQFSVKSIERNGRLPGTKSDTYNRIPLPMMLAISMCLGLVYVIFLPFIGLAMVTWLLGTKAAQLAGIAVLQSGRVRRPGWAPALAFLSRSKHAEPGTNVDEADEAPDAWMKEAEKKLKKTDHSG